MITRLNKIELLRLFVIIAGCIISYQCFGNSFSFVISIIFFVFVAFIIIRDLDLSGALSGISVLCPIVKPVLQGLFLNRFKYEWLIAVINHLLQSHNIMHVATKDEIDTVIVYFLMFIIICIFDNKDKSTLGKHVEDNDPEFRNKSFAEKNEAFCKHLTKRINDINMELNWNSETYVPIAAEVEMSAGKKIERYDDMLKCLKEGRKNTTSLPQMLVDKIKFSIFGKIGFVNRIVNILDRKFETKRVYLVLGDPGSGKSVSLRKLCSDLLEETRITGKTPVYINLKTWTDKGRQWSNSHLPTQRDLITYVREELYSKGDQFTDGFLDKYFDKMLEYGRWYFIFDSFDEMPCLMSGDKNNELIQHISKLIYDFLSGSNQSGGIIASRLYNRPAGTLNQTYTLTLQKFSDKRIRAMIKQYMSGDVDSLIRDLFKKRPDLVTLCRNPFHLSLLINYVQKNDGNFPENQFDLFKDFIIGRLTDSKHKIEENNLSIDDIYNAAVLMAINMQKNQGLDYPVDMLLDNTTGLSKEDWEKHLFILEYVKLCRLNGSRQIVSFVHRRFQEFFYVDAMMNGAVTINKSDYVGVLDNTGIRDALVLYSQIGNPNQVQSIIEYCCSVIESNTNNISNIRNEGCVHFVNALYFLTDAFGYRKELLGEKINLIAGLNEFLVRETDYIVQMAIVNSISLLSAEDIQNTVLKVFGLHNRWLNAAVVNNCQIIKKLNHDEEVSFCSYFFNMPTGELFRSFFNIDFSLSLSDCFSYVRFVHGTIPILIIGMMISYILIMTSNITITILTHYWDIFYTFISTSTFKEMILTFSDFLTESPNQDLAIAPNRTIFTTIGIVMCVLISLSNLILLTIEEIAEDRIRIRTRQYNKPLERNNKKDNVIWKGGLRVQMIFSRMVVVFYYLLAPLFLLIKESQNFLTQNQQPWKEILQFPILMIILIVSIIELTHEIKKPMIEFTKLLTDAIRPDKLFRLVIGLPKSIFKLLSLVSKSLVVAIKENLAIITLFVLLATAPIIVCYIIGIEITADHVGAVYLILMISLIIILSPILLVITAFEIAFDLKWINQHLVNKISREELVQNLKRLHLGFTRRKYLQCLINNDVKLVGDWPDNRRILFDDDVLNKNLALWDCKECSIDNYFSNGL
ncbi:MAG: NACHT domain-containing protein [Lachnospiraceae bacterium]|nr:NACHT domain-containing protein [Lachnospiraceae bacterium]